MSATLVMAYDLETTGLLNQSTNDPEQQPGIVEIGAVKYAIDENRPLQWFEDFQMLIDPECLIEESAQKITGIGPEMVAGKNNFFQAFPMFRDFCFGVRHLVTFNGEAYDNKVLQYQMIRYGVETKFPWPPIHHDVMKIGGDIAGLVGKQGNKYPKLSEMYNHCHGRDYDDHHRGLSDAKATMGCWKWLIDNNYVLGL